MCRMEAGCFAFDPERPGSICVTKPERDSWSVLRALFHSDIREQHNAQPLIDRPDLGEIFLSIPLSTVIDRVRATRPSMIFSPCSSAIPCLRRACSSGDTSAVLANWRFRDRLSSKSSTTRVTPRRSARCRRQLFGRACKRRQYSDFHGTEDIVGSVPTRLQHICGSLLSADFKSAIFRVQR